MAAAALSAIAAATSDALVAIGTGFLIADAVAIIATGFVALAGLRVLAGKKPRLPAAEERKTMIRSAIAPRTLVYGRAKVSGPMVFATTSGAANEYLHLVIPLASHEIDAVEQIYFGDDLVTLDASGYVQESPYRPTDPTAYATEAHTRTAATSEVFTLTESPTSVLSCQLVYRHTSNGHELDDAQPVAFTRDGSAVTVTYYSPIETWKTDLGYQPTVVIAYRYDRVLDSTARVIFGMGSDDQHALPEMLAECDEWTENHRLRGIAYAYVRLKKDVNAYPYGIPNISCVIRGRKVYDPRTSNTAWSENPALCLRDYLLHRYGLGADAGQINDAAVEAAADACDEEVDIPGGVQSRYTCGAVLTTEATRAASVQALLSSMAGITTWSNGQYHIHAGSWSAPEGDPIDESYLRGAIKVRSQASQREAPNGIRGVFVNPDNGWQSADIQPVQSAVALAADDGIERWIDLRLDATTDPYTAQRLAWVQLRRARQEILVEMPCNLRALRVSLWQVVPITIARLGWDEKPFRVVGWRLAADGRGVDLTLQEDAESSWTPALADLAAVDPAPNTNLQDPRTSNPPGIPSISETLYQSTGSAGLKIRLTATWSATDGIPPTLYEMAWADLTASSQSGPEPRWTTTRGTEPSLAIQDAIQTHEYIVQVRAMNALGVWSDQVFSDLYRVRGLSIPPADVSGLTSSADGRGLWLNWDLHHDLDVRIGGRIEIRHGPTGSTWASAVYLDDIPGDSATLYLPTRLEGAYHLKAVDSTGNYCDNAASIEVTGITYATTLDSIVEETAFAGTKTGCEVESGELVFRAAYSAGDPDWENVVLAMHMDGPSTFTDETGHTVTAYGNAQIVSDAQAFGGYSAEFDGTGDSLVISDSSDFDFTGDFCVSLRVKPSDLTVGTLISTNTSYNGTAHWNNGFEIYKINDKIYAVLYDSSGSKTYLMNQAVVSTSSYKLITLERVDGVVYLRVDGVLGSSTIHPLAYVSFNYPIYPGGFTIGASYPSAGYLYDFAGRVDEVRIWNHAQYGGADFTPPSAAYSDGPVNLTDATYDTAATIALAGIETFDLVADLECTATGTSVDVDERAGLVDSWDSWDEDGEQNATQVATWYSTSPDGSTWGDWQRFRLVTTITAQHVKCRVTMAADWNTTITIPKMQFHAKQE